MKICSRCKIEKDESQFNKYKNGFQSNCIKCRAERRALDRDSMKIWKSQNGWKEYYKEYTQKRRLSDPLFRLSGNLRSRLYKALKGISKSSSAVKDMGCTLEFLKTYLECKFLEGMTWENYGKWHVDHIKPISMFELSNVDEVKKACHYSNLQPLWAKDNFIKSNKIVG
jgi:hypothetical protein